MLLPSLDFAGTVVDFCYNRQMFLLRPFMASCNPRQRRLRFLLQPPLLFGTIDKFFCYIRFMVRLVPFVPRKLMQSTARPGATHWSAEPWTVGAKSCHRLMGKLQPANDGICSRKLRAGEVPGQAPSPETTCGLAVVSGGDPTSGGDPANDDDLASFVVSFPSWTFSPDLR